MKAIFNLLLVCLFCSATAHAGPMDEFFRIYGGDWNPQNTVRLDSANGDMSACSNTSSLSSLKVKAVNGNQVSIELVADCTTASGFRFGERHEFLAQLTESPSSHGSKWLFSATSPAETRAPTIKAGSYWSPAGIYLTNGVSSVRLVAAAGGQMAFTFERSLRVAPAWTTMLVHTGLAKK